MCVCVCVCVILVCWQLTRPFREVDRICFETSYRIKPRVVATDTLAPAATRRGASAASATSSSAATAHAEPSESGTAATGDEEDVEEVRTPIVWENVTDVLSLGTQRSWLFS
jgi:hypothetical protein